ncbi:unnamed protein product [Amoebophrya sp. A25]|nr:unnamed protein product [Amoebophrya sp. A25]|eukprot:GSA25T00002115001.1
MSTIMSSEGLGAPLRQTTAVVVRVAPLKDPDICKAGGADSGLFLPLFGEDENDWDINLRQFLYLIGTLWCFMGVAIVADVFMGAIEKVTSVKRTITDPKTGRTTTVKIWNDTVANLTLMALGSSAPEILLSVIELFSNDFHSGALGPSTIVGSAAFNLLVIIAVCVLAIPDGEIRKIKDLGVFAITAFCSVWAYIWLLLILVWVSEDVVEPWEGVISFMYFPVLVVTAYLADIGVICKRSAVSSTVIAAQDLSKEELAELAMRIQKRHGSAQLSEEQMARLMQVETASKSRAARRIAATRGKLAGGAIGPDKEVASAKTKMSVVTPAADDAEGETIAEIGFLEGCIYAVLEGGGAVQLVVSRTSNEGRATIDFATRDGDAKQPEDYIATKGTLVFEHGETEKTISVPIVDDDKYEEDKKFYVDLTNFVEPPGVKYNVPKEYSTATVTIIDDDLPGVIMFEFETLSISESKEDATHKVHVLRKNGSTGEISCQFTTEEDSATKDMDYVHTEGMLTFAHNEREKVIPIRVMARGRYESLEKFRIILSDVAGGAKFDVNTDGGEDTAVCTISLCPEEKQKRFIDGAGALLRVNKDKMSVGHANYKEQFISAIYVNGSPEEQAEASTSDWIIHFITVFWKVLFACIPPTDYANGWVCFFSSLAMIGVVTAIIGDIAAMLGCVLNIPSSITAITFVALGTSLPDLFASKASAEQDPYADASVGNVTGSNSVNVFLGLGLPWMIGAFYWQSEGRTPDWENTILQKKASLLTRSDLKDGGFVVVAGSLGYSVMIFTICALACIATLIVRRSVYGGELGGPKVPKIGTAAFFVGLWGLYILLSSLKALDDE